MKEIVAVVTAAVIFLMFIVGSVTMYEYKVRMLDQEIILESLNSGILCTKNPTIVGNRTEYVWSCIH